MIRIKYVNAKHAPSLGPTATAGEASRNVYSTVAVRQPQAIFLITSETDDGTATHGGIRRRIACGARNV